MITREEIQELAQFEDRQGCAISFYFQPSTPRNKAHKEQVIRVKDLAGEALRQLERLRLAGVKEKSQSAHADIGRILQFSEELRGNGTHAKAVFACSGQNFWREYNLPPHLPGTELFVDRHFHLKPLAHLLGAFPSLAIMLLDRHRARLFDLRLGELTEIEGFFHPLSRRGRSDGFAGYDGGHAERRVADEARQHFKFVADFIKNALEKRSFDKWILGCQDIHWPQLEQQLHPLAAQNLLGRFSSEVAHATPEEIRSDAEQIFVEWQKSRRNDMVREAISQARGNGRGVTGLRRVLRSLEMGEIQTLLLSDNYVSQAVECTGCGHLDAHLVSYCPVCGRETREVVDVAEAILPWVIRNDVELFYVKDDPELDRVGNIAALLRFRSSANNNKVQMIREPGTSQSPAGRPGKVGRYRGLASGQ